MSKRIIIGKIYDYTGDDRYLIMKGKVVVHGRINEADQLYMNLPADCVWLITPVGHSVGSHLISSSADFS